MLVLIIFSVVLFAIDLVTKTIFLAGSSVVLVPGVLSIEPVVNYGAAFGFFQSSRLFLVIMTFIILSVAVAFYVKFKQGRKNVVFNTGCAFVLGGALGNLFDRLFMSGGYVRDFIRFNFLDFINFPICNFADVFLNIGMVILIVYFVFIYKGNVSAGKI